MSYNPMTGQFYDSPMNDDMDAICSQALDQTSSQHLPEQQLAQTQQVAPAQQMAPAQHLAPAPFYSQMPIQMRPPHPSMIYSGNYNTRIIISRGLYFLLFFLLWLIL